MLTVGPHLRSNNAIYEHAAKLALFCLLSLCTLLAGVALPGWGCQNVFILLSGGDKVFMMVALRNNLWSGRLDLSCFLYRIHYLHIAVSLYFSIIKHLNGIINNFIVFQIYCLLGSRRYVTQRIKNIIYLFKIYRI